MNADRKIADLEYQIDALRRQIEALQYDLRTEREARRGALMDVWEALGEVQRPADDGK